MCVGLVCIMAEKSGKTLAGWKVNHFCCTAHFTQNSHIS